MSCDVRMRRLLRCDDAMSMGEETCGLGISKGEKRSLRSEVKEEGSFFWNSDELASGFMYVWVDDARSKGRKRA